MIAELRTVHRGGPVMGVQMLDHFDRYQHTCGYTEATVKRRRLTLRCFAEYLAPKDLAAATTMDIEEWLSTKQAARTRHAYRSDLRVFYAWAVERDVLESDPARATGRVRVPKSLPRPVGPEVASLLSHGNRKTRQMVALAMLAGLRCAEIAALRAEDVWLHHAEPVIVVRDGKGHKDRRVPVSAELREALGALPSSGPLFRGKAGRDTVTAATVSARIGRHLKGAGIDATAHQLRHSFGTAAARSTGGDVVLVGSWMGHGSPATTMGYIQLTAGRGREFIENLYGGEAA